MKASELRIAKDQLIEANLDFHWTGRCPDWCTAAVQSGCTNRSPGVCLGCGKPLVQYGDAEYIQRGKAMHDALVEIDNGS